MPFHLRPRLSPRFALVPATLSLLALLPNAEAVSKTALQDIAAYTPTSLSPIAPGVDLDGYTSDTPEGTAGSNVVTVDLTRPGVSTAAISAHVTDTRPVQQWATDSGAVIAVNADYYAIYGSSAPQGPAVQAGIVRKALARKRYVQGVGVDGVARRALIWLDGTVQWGRGAPQRMERYNSDLDGGDMPADSLSLFDSGWGASKVGFGNAPKKVSYSLVGADGKVIRSSRKFTAQRVPAGGALLVGTGRWTSIGSLRRGTALTHAQAVQTDAPAAFSWAVGGGLQIVRAGSAVHHAPEDNSDPHAARTAIGWKNDGHTLLLVTVEHSSSSAGQGANEIADELQALGATEAVLLDGGGSTTLEARLRGGTTDTQIGVTQDGFQRKVPNAIGVFVPKGSGQITGIDVSTDSRVVFPGLQRRVLVKPYDEWYGPSGADTTGATISSTNAVFTQSGPLLVKATGTGSDDITATLSGFSGSTGVRVLPALTALRAPDEVRIDPGTSTTVRLQGIADNAEQAPIDAQDVTTSADPSVVRVAATPTGLLSVSTLPGTMGAVVPVTFTVSGVSVTMIVRSGWHDTALPVLGTPGTWAARGARSQRAQSLPRYGGVGLKLTLLGKGLTVIRPKVGPISFPGDAKRIALWAFADGKPHTLQAIVTTADGASQVVTLGQLGSKRSWRHLEVALPAATTQLRELRVLGPRNKSLGATQIGALIARS